MVQAGPVLVDEMTQVSAEYVMQENGVPVCEVCVDERPVSEHPAELPDRIRGPAVFVRPPGGQTRNGTGVAAGKIARDRSGSRSPGPPLIWTCLSKLRRLAVIAWPIAFFR